MAERVIPDESSFLTSPECLLSVVVPAYQAEGSISRLLDSLCAWDGQEVEFIIVNDGSVDGTHALVEDRARVDARIRLIDTDNKGRSAARNRGVSAARGEWIMFADADDYLLSGWQTYVRALLSSDQDLIIFGMVQSTKLQANSVVDDTHADSARFVEIAAGMIKRSLIDGSFETLIPEAEKFEWSACWGRLYRRSRLQQLANRTDGAVFPENIKFSEDRLFNLLYLDEIADGAAVFRYTPIYYWDLGLSSTVAHISLDDAKTLHAYRSELRKAIYNLSPSEQQSLMAAEAASHFRRSASLPLRDLRAVSRPWKELVIAGDLSGCRPQMPRFLGKRAWVYAPSLSLLFSGHSYTALCWQHFVQYTSRELRRMHKRM